MAFNTHYSALIEGLAVFPLHEEEPEDLEDLWPRMKEPELQRAHDARIEPVNAAHRQTAYFAVGGLVLGGAGIGVAAAIEGDSRTGAAVAGGAGLVALLVGAVGALASQPSGREQVQADARAKLFIPGEDDLSAVERGVNRMNGKRRRYCASRVSGMNSNAAGSAEEARLDAAGASLH